MDNKEYSFSGRVGAAIDQDSLRIYIPRSPELNKAFELVELSDNPAEGGSETWPGVGQGEWEHQIEIDIEFTIKWPPKILEAVETARKEFAEIYNRYESLYGRLDIDSKEYDRLLEAEDKENEQVGRKLQVVLEKGTSKLPQ